MYHCFKCKAAWESSLRQPAVKETCDGCGAYLHCCKNCTHHRRGYPNECYIPDTEKIANKSLANFCDEFEFVSDATLAARQRTTGRTGTDLEELLGDEKPSDAPASQVKAWLDTSDRVERDFDNLFKD